MEGWKVGDAAVAGKRGVGGFVWAVRSRLDFWAGAGLDRWVRRGRLGSRVVVCGVWYGM